jgi:hypothetical protein
MTGEHGLPEEYRRWHAERRWHEAKRAWYRETRPSTGWPSFRSGIGGAGRT